MAKIVFLTTLITTIVSIWAELIIDDSKADIEHMTILSGGVRLCSHSESTREKILSLNETAYIFLNNSIALSFESSCSTNNKHFRKITNNKRYDKVNRKSILKITFTADGLVLETKENIKYSQNGFKKINSEIINDVDCLKRSYILNILDENKYSWFMDKNTIEGNKNSWFMDECDFLFGRKNQDLCPVYQGVRNIDNSIEFHRNSSLDILLFDPLLIKPISTTVKIETDYCKDKSLITEFTPSDFLNHEEDSESWFKFDYDVIKSGSNSSLTISVAGIPIDHMNYYTVCDKEPIFSFSGLSNIKTVCNPINQLYNFDIDNYFKNYSYEQETQNLYYKLYNPDIPDDTYTPETRYNISRTRYTINFPYIIILMMILVIKAICGYAIYKRRQARVAAFASTRLVEHYGNVSPVGRGTIIVAATNRGDYPRQPNFNIGPSGQPSEDLPPAYNDLQQPSDINPPGYEESCKNQSKSPPGYENSSRDNVGFQIEEETSSENHTTDSVEINQLST